MTKISFEERIIINKRKSSRFNSNKRFVVPRVASNLNVSWATVSQQFTIVFVISWNQSK